MTPLDLFDAPPHSGSPTSLAAYDHWAEEQAREEARRHAPDDGVAYEETEF